MCEVIVLHLQCLTLCGREDRRRHGGSGLQVLVTEVEKVEKVDKGLLSVGNKGRNVKDRPA